MGQSAPGLLQTPLYSAARHKNRSITLKIIVKMVSGEEKAWYRGARWLCLRVGTRRRRWRRRKKREEKEGKRKREGKIIKVYVHHSYLRCKCEFLRFSDPKGLMESWFGRSRLCVCMFSREPGETKCATTNKKKQEKKISRWLGRVMGKVWGC